jgi:hypothetical protein
MKNGADEGGKTLSVYAADDGYIGLSLTHVCL